MKNVTLIKYTFSFLSLILLSACGGQPAATRSGSNSFEPDSGNNLITLTSSAADDYNIALGAAIQLYVEGGSAPYTYSIISGSGSVNSSTGVFTASSSVTGSVAIRVTDAKGSKDTLYLYVGSNINDGGETARCLARSAPATVKADSVEAFADSTLHPELAEQVVVGMGFRFLNNEAVGIYLKTHELDLENAAVDTANSYSFRHGDFTETSIQGEIYVQAPAGYYVYGFGSASNSNGQDVSLIKIYVAKPNSNTESFDLKECFVTPTDSGCHNTVTPSASLLTRYSEYKGTPAEALLAIGLSVNSNKVDKIAAKATELTWTDCE